jgi:hypothetical protein
VNRREALIKLAEGHKVKYPDTDMIIRMNERGDLLVHEGTNNAQVGLYELNGYELVKEPLRWERELKAETCCSRCMNILWAIPEGFVGKRVRVVVEEIISD